MLCLLAALQVYGALSACYACLLLVCGKKPYSKREVDGLLAQVEVFKEQLKRTGRWHNMMRKRCTIILEPVKKHFKVCMARVNRWHIHKHVCLQANEGYTGSQGFVWVDIFHFR